MSLLSPSGEPDLVVIPPPSQLELDRRRYRSSRARRSILIAVAWTVVLLGTVGFGITRTKGWARFRPSFLNWHQGSSTFDSIIKGMWLNVRILVCVYLVVLVLGILLACLRTLNGAVFAPLRVLAVAYVDFFRGIPLLILIYLVGFGLPGLRLSYLPKDPTILGSVALVLCYSSYVAEVFRSGIQGVHPSQKAAAASLGLSGAQSMRLVVLPQAVRRVVPPLLNDFVSLQKDVGLVSILGAVDAIRAAQISSSLSYNFTPYMVAGLLFIILAIPSGRVADWFALKAVRREQAGGVF